MKLKTIIKTCSAILISSFISFSCVKDVGKEVATEQTDLTNKSFVQVYNGILSSARNYVYVDGSAVTGAALAYNGIFPLTPASFSINSGVRAFLVRDTLGTSTQPPMSFTQNLQAGSYYTVFLYDTVNAPKQKTVINNVVIPTDTSARIRFAFFAYAPFLIPQVDIFSVKLNRNLFSNVSVTDVTDFIPINSRSTDTLIVRVAGSGTNLMNRTVSGTPAVTTFSPIQLVLTPTRLRSFTLVFRGSYRTDLTTASQVRNLTLMVNN